MSERKELNMIIKNKAYKGFEIIINPLKMTIKMFRVSFVFVLVLHLIFLITVVIYRYYNFTEIELKIFNKYFETLFSLKPSSGKQLNSNNFNMYILEPFLIIIKHSFYLYYLIPILFFYYKFIAKDTFKTKHLRGSKLIDEEACKLEVLKRFKNKNRFFISKNIPFPVELEPRHIFIAGAPGVGKTVIASHILKSLRKDKVKTIVFDAKDGEFVSQLYDKTTDHIVNPFDKRSSYLNIFDSIKTEPDYDYIAGSIIPENKKDSNPFWRNAAVSVLSGCLQIAHNDKQTNNDYILELLNLTNRDLYYRLENINHESAKYLEKSDSGVTNSVMSTLIEKAKIFKYLKRTTDKEINIENWITSDEAGFIFLPFNEKQKESLTGLYTLFINIISNEILSLNDDKNRRIFLMLDEFHSLHKIDKLPALLDKGRSKGACVLIGCQSKNQIDYTYDKSIANNIINVCNTKLIFRLNDKESCAYFSDSISEKETVQFEESTSVGVDDNKDGENYRAVHRNKKVVMPSEISSLNDLNYYLQLPGINITKTSINYIKLKNISERYIENPVFSLSNKESSENDRIGSDTDYTSSDHESAKEVKVKENPKHDKISNDMQLDEDDFDITIY